MFGAECHLYGAGRFNAALHRGELLAGGTPLASGSVRLVETRWHGTEHRYRVELRGGAHAWAEQAAKGWFRELEVAYEGRLLPTEIAAGWSDDSPVKFLPVYRDRYEIENGDAGLRPPERLLSTDDYHPFLSIRALVQALFAKAGYTVESAFMESPWFRSLYMSGAYASHDTRVRQQKMGFLARRKADRTTTANALGRVEANPFVTHNTVGNLVDAFSPQEVDETGATLTDAYSAGGCLRIEEGELCFRPLTEVSVGFEYELRYTTDYRIRSRTRLTGFDSVWLGEDADVRFELANRFEDRREALRPSFQYRIVVFDHTEGNRWTLRCTTDGAETTLTDFTTRSTLFTTPQGTTLVNARLYRNVSGVYVPYTEDWALYDGYIGETGRTEVQITVRTSPESVTPTAPKYFRQISFYGAEEGMNFTISRRCRLRPCFSSAPGYGAALAFDDVARHEIRQAELLRALAHLFDLRFHTDEQLKRVYIEPACDFYDATTVWEWSDRILGDTPIAGADRALDVHDRRTWGYRDADGAVARFDAANDTRFGRWSHATASKAAKQGEEVSLNELFAPTLCEAGRYANAPSALILCVGDRDDATTDDATAVTPRIVRWMGLHRPARRRTVGLSARRRTLSAGGLPLHGRRRDGGVHPLFRGPRCAGGAPPLLRRTHRGRRGPSAGDAPAADRPRRVRGALPVRRRSASHDPLPIPVPVRRRKFALHAARRRGLRSARRRGALYVRPTLRRLTMRHEERLLEELRRELRGLSTTQALAYLLREGLLDLRRAEEAAIRRDVARRTARGEKKCYAMGETAYDYCCSYEKVRGIIYRNKENQ
ncbi:MAG: hypothetical protein ACLSHL_02250 [Alistipes communis]